MLFTCAVMQHATPLLARQEVVTNMHCQLPTSVNCCCHGDWVFRQQQHKQESTTWTFTAIRDHLLPDRPWHLSSIMKYRTILTAKYCQHSKRHSEITSTIMFFSVGSVGAIVQIYNFWCFNRRKDILFILTDKTVIFWRIKLCL